MESQMQKHLEKITQKIRKGEKLLSTFAKHESNPQPRSRKMQQANRMTKLRRKKSKRSWRASGRRNVTAVTRPRRQILMAITIISTPNISKRFKFTFESAKSLQNHESSRLTRKIPRWTTRGSGHSSEESKMRGIASACKRTGAARCRGRGKGFIPT